MKKLNSKNFIRMSILYTQLFLKSYCLRACGLGSQCRPNECIFGSGKPPGGSGFRVGGYMSQVREWGS